MEIMDYRWLRLIQPNTSLLLTTTTFGARFSDITSAMYQLDRKSTRLNSSHANISYAVFCLKKKNISLLSNSSAPLFCYLFSFHLLHPSSSLSIDNTPHLLYSILDLPLPLSLLLHFSLLSHI